MGFVEIVPRHFIDTNGKDRLEIGIDPGIDESGNEEFVGVKGGSVTKVENERVAQRDRLFVPSLLIA